MQDYFDLGRTRQGEIIDITVICPSEPDECPTATFMGISGQVLQAKIPLVEDTKFSLGQYIGSEFDDGHYYAVVTYQIASVPEVSYHWFEVIGGNAVGSVVDLHSVSRPLGVAVISHTEDGTLNIGYNPR